ncbi:MAG: MGMT family protein [Oscillospiraceae bacterium]|nr:MGMT family protein [Oscillospiraceae bacterium]
MTDFEKRVYDVVKTIPYGCVKTYAEIGMELGNPKLARAIGNALHKNPDPKGTPCFRVVHSDGRLCEAFAFGGINAQKELLEAEGILIKDNKVVF